MPAGGFAYYNETDRTIHTSVDGVQWAEGVSTDHPYWEPGDEVFPGLVYAETAGQFWTSADSTTWTYDFTGPPGGDYGLHLSRTNLGIVATRVTQIPVTARIAIRRLTHGDGAPMIGPVVMGGSVGVRGRIGQRTRRG